MADAIKTLGITLEVSSEEGSPQTFVTVGNITDMSGPNMSRNIIPTSNLASTAATFMGGLLDGGEFTFTVNLDPNLASHQQLLTRFEDGDAVQWRITLTDSGAAVVNFNGILSALPWPGNMPFDDKVTTPVTVKVTGKPWTTY